MNRDDIIRMAQHAGGFATNFNGKWTFYQEALETFGAMAFQAGTAAERKRQEEQLHTCSAACDRPLCVARRKGAEEERKACADICDAHASIEGIGQRCAEEIRARGKE
jgi:hypothetical protein